MLFLYSNAAAENSSDKEKLNKIIPKKKFSKSASESKLNIPRKESARRRQSVIFPHEPINEEKSEESETNSEESDIKRKDQIDLLKNQLTKTLPKSASGSR